MALQGNLKDFAITNILPMIKTENKTGMLEVKYKDEYIRISFLQGQVAFAETIAKRDSKRVRDTLLANGLMSREGWQKLQKQQSDSLKSMWSVLSTMVSLDTVKRLLHRQVTDAVFDLMRFQKGVYKFTPEKSVEYPDKLITPLDVDFLLMDGARISDELSMVEKKLPKKETILRKAILSEESPDESVELDAAQKEYAETLELEILKERGVTVSDAERSVLSVTGEYRSVGDLLDTADLSYFDSCSAIVSLLQKKVLTPVSRRQAVSSRGPAAKSGAALGYVLLAAAVALLAFAGYYRYKSLPTQIEYAEKAVGGLLAYGVTADMEELYYRLKVFSFQTGKEAGSLRDIVTKGLADPKDLIDPWGRPYRYIRDKSRFALFSSGPDERGAGDDIFFEIR